MTVSSSSDIPELADLPCIHDLKRKDGSVVFILGRREIGKSVMAYRLAEILGRPTYAVSPEQRPPRGVVELALADVVEQPPIRSTLILDDLPVYASQRDYGNPLVRVLEQLVPVVRHRRKLTLICCSQSSSLTDKFLLTADLIACKAPSILYEETERQQVVRFYKKIAPEFERMSDSQRKRRVYIFSEAWRGWAWIALPQRG